MTLPASIISALQGPRALPLRAVEQVMDVERLGAMHQSRLSFMRSLMRRIMRECWQIKIDKLALDQQGYGTVIYRIQTPNRVYSLVIFSEYLADEDRNDRVIASKWDLTMALVDGEIDDDYLQMLQRNVPRQEAGRVDARVFVLSRANRSMRNFDYIVDKLAGGEQPDIAKLSAVGYLYRTTAVYGSGKLGMADWEKVSSCFVDFNRPFSAEMFVCLMLRNFSLLQVEHIAKNKSVDSFRPMKTEIKRFIGIGNSTGLGMAPYLINHPLLINRWIEMRELALARIRVLGAIDTKVQQQLYVLLERAKQYTEQTVTEDEGQTANNKDLLEDLTALEKNIRKGLHDWDSLLVWSERHCSLQGQEMLVSLMLELYPELVDDLENYLVVDEMMDLDPLMPLKKVQQIIQKRYGWALSYDFSSPQALQYFWYRSQEKMEPRLGQASFEPGEDRQMPLGIAWEVRKCFDLVTSHLQSDPQQSTGHFVLVQPQLRGILRRGQSMNKSSYGDIQVNLLDENVLPMHLLRCKLAFFGVGKFDPKSKLWVRNTMFQGAPLLEEIGLPFNDDWFMPLAPSDGQAKEAS
ncbi:MAG: hypothetical protein OFPI_11110 [Osedax symbiont Rs2]|nr:MAG: hypothetical protein OFPI_11110 [Osedax symbiont Rs2]